MVCVRRVAERSTVGRVPPHRRAQGTHGIDHTVIASVQIARVDPREDPREEVLEMQ